MSYHSFLAVFFFESLIIHFVFTEISCSIKCMIGTWTVVSQRNKIIEHYQISKMQPAKDVFAFLTGHLRSKTEDLCAPYY